ncbi:MAG TPA: DUF4112 domain-containing protein [Candidatus Limnocylindrales bacterium]
MDRTRTGRQAAPTSPRLAAGRVARTASDTRIEQAERRIALIARLLDDVVTIPGTHHRIGADAVVGLIPGIGDIASAAVGMWVIVEAARFRLPQIVLARMVLNTVVDLVVGSVPILGDLFDVVFKSNTRNVELFRRHATNPDASTRGHRLFLGGLVLIVLGALWLIAIGLGALLSVQIPTP